MVVWARSERGQRCQCARTYCRAEPIAACIVGQRCIKVRKNILQSRVDLSRADQNILQSGACIAACIAEKKY